MNTKGKPKRLRAKKAVSAKKEVVLKKSKRATRRLSSAVKPRTKIREKAHQSLLGKMKGTVLYESDLISPIQESWDANSSEV